MRTSVVVALATALSAAVAGCSNGGGAAREPTTPAPASSAATAGSGTPGAGSPTPTPSATYTPQPLPRSGDSVAGAGILVLAFDTEPCTSTPVAGSAECAPQPLAGVAVTVRAANGAGAVQTLTTGADGQARVPVDPGSYSVVGSVVAGFPAPTPSTTVNVEEGHAVVALLAYNRGFQ